MSHRLRRLLGAAVLLLLLIAGSGTAVQLYAEFHWFGSLGQQARFWKLLSVEAGAWVALFLLAAGGVWGALRILLRRGGPVQVRRRLGDLEIAEALPERWVRLGAAAVAVVAGVLVAGPFAESLGRQALFALESEPWGTPDPVLDRDPRFYVFYLPLLRTAWSVLVSTGIWVAIALVTLLLLSGRVTATENGVRVDALARRTLAWLGAGALLMVAGHFWLSTFEVPAGGPVGYAEVHAEIPARRLVAVLALVAAAAVAWSERRGDWRPVVTTLVLLAASVPLGVAIYPDLVQRFRVEPNELELERPYIGAEVEATRTAFGLDRVRRLSYRPGLRPPSLEDARRHTSGLPLWDDRPLKATYDQLQGLVAYHEFPDVDADRYGAEGSREQVAIGVREFAPSRLATSARTWQNLHLRYTHGSGWVVTAVDRASEGGEPHYFVRDLPPEVSDDAPEGLSVGEPNVYFGELTTQYVVVPPDSFPETGRPTGVDLDNLVRRGLLAWALGSKNILLRNPGEGTSRLLWRRDVVRRVRHLVPFLLVDADPYPVVHEGRVKWVVEAYAGSRRFPLSRPADAGGRRTNYLRSVVKGVVDGVTGETRLYVVEPDDPILTTYRRAFSRLFQPLDEMPPGLREHLRYPQTVFRVQARMLEAYHMTEPEEFYQKQDLWSLGREVYGGDAAEIEPYFLLMPFPSPPEEEDPGPTADEGLGQEFLLTVPFTPRNRDNLSAFLMARNDGEAYGEMWLFDLEGRRQIFGPRQVEVQIDQDPVISQQLSLWQQQGSRAIRGHLLLVPVNGALLYVEPLFLVAEDREGAAPGLKRVIASFGDRVAMGETLDDALQRLLGERPRTAPLEEGALPLEGVEGRDEAAGEGPAAAPGAGASAGDALSRIRSLLRRADEALRAGDLERFGRLWEELRSEGVRGDTLPPPSAPSGGEADTVGGTSPGTGTQPDTAGAASSGEGRPGGPL